MAKKAKAKAESKGDTILDNGVVVEGNVVTGESDLTAKEQGQLARGEIDEAGKATGKEVEKDDAKTMRPTQTLYQGRLSAEAISAKTGEEVSWTWEQNMPTTEEGCYRQMEAAHGVGSLIRDTFKLDAQNVIDPTKRTALERP